MTWIKTSPDAGDRSKRRRDSAKLAAAVALLTLGACDGLLDVELPGRIDARTLNDPVLARTLVISAQGDFECFFSNYVAGSANFTDELFTSTEFFGYNQFNARQNHASSNNNDGCVSGNAHGIYTPLHRSAFTNDQAIQRLEEWSDQEVANRKALIGQAAVYAGYTYTMMGEGYCSGVVEGGPELTPSQVLQEAEKRFTKAIENLTAASGAEARTLLNAARVGRARVRLRLGDKAGAAEDARLVSEGFRLNATYSGAHPDRENQVFVDHIRNQYLSVEPPFRNLTVGGNPDPRVEVTFTGGKGPDGFTEYWISAKYPRPNSPIRLSSWEEAQLILAEAVGGQAAVDHINAVRAVHGIAPFEPISLGEAAILEQIIEERRREFFLEGFRLGDRRAYDLPWEQGFNHKNNLQFGELTCFPLAQQERDQNPNIN